MQLHEAQKKIANSTKRFRVVCAGRRFGKTILAGLELVGMATSMDDANCVYVAPTYQQARDICWAELVKLTESIAEKVNESRLEITVSTIKGGTSKIALRGWESIETLRGQAFDFMVLDEVAMMRKFWMQWREVLRPALTDRRGSVLFISTPKGFNHFYDLYNTKDEDFESFQFTTYDNPFVPKDEIDKAKIELPENAFYQEYMADFRKQEGLVYKEFNRGRHLYKDIDINSVETISGVDFGYTNPACVLTIKKDRDNCYWVENEWYKTGQTHEQITEYVLAQNFNKVYADPASPEAIKVMTDRGINISEVSKTKDSITTGIQKVRELFKQGRLKIHEDCVNLISELESYAYPETTKAVGTSEIPIKENDHALDALRYALMTNSPKTIDYSGIRHRVAMTRRNPITNFID